MTRIVYSSDNDPLVTGELEPSPIEAHPPTCYCDECLELLNDEMVVAGLDIDDPAVVRAIEVVANAGDVGPLVTPDQPEPAGSSVDTTPARLSSQSDELAPFGYTVNGWPRKRPAPQDRGLFMEENESEELELPSETAERTGRVDELLLGYKFYFDTGGEA